MKMLIFGRLTNLTCFIFFFICIVFLFVCVCLCYCKAFADSLFHRMGADSTHMMMTLGQLSLTLFMFPHSRVKSPIATNEGLSTDICDGHPFHLSLFLSSLFSFCSLFSFVFALLVQSSVAARPVCPDFIQWSGNQFLFLYQFTKVMYDILIFYTKIYHRLVLSNCNSQIFIFQSIKM